MNTYRKSLALDPDNTYTYVELGPVPEVPLWHHLAEPSRHPFPTEKAAFAFANSTKARHASREVQVLTTDGERFIV